MPWFWKSSKHCWVYSEGEYSWTLSRRSCGRWAPESCCCAATDAADGLATCWLCERTMGVGRAEDPMLEEVPIRYLVVDGRLVVIRGAAGEDA